MTFARKQQEDFFIDISTLAYRGIKGYSLQSLYLPYLTTVYQPSSPERHLSVLMHKSETKRSEAYSIDSTSTSDQRYRKRGPAGSGLEGP